MSQPSHSRRFQGFDAYTDLKQGLGLTSLAWKMALLKLRNQYRGSMLGPFWITISSAVFFIGLAIVYSQLWGLDLAEYFPWLAIGFSCWILISTAISEACACMISAEALIKTKPMPISLFAMRNAFSLTLFFAHQLPLFLCVFPFLGKWPGASVLILPISFFFIVVNAFLLSFVMGMACARFRDLEQVVASILQLFFFLTPIIWKPEMLGPNAVLVYFNPLASFIEVIRAPILGQEISPYCWPIIFGVTVLNALLAYFLLQRYRARIVFWV